MAQKNTSTAAAHSKKKTGTAADRKGRTDSAQGKTRQSRTDSAANAKKKGTPTPEEKDTHREEGLAASPFIQFFLIVFAIVLAVFIYLENLSGSVGGAIGGAVKGVFSVSAFAIPPIILLIAVRWRRDVEEGYLLTRILCSICTLIIASSFWHIIAGDPVTYDAAVLFEGGKALSGGGFLGGLLGTLLWKCFYVAAFVILAAALILFACMMFELTPKGLYTLIAYKHKLAKERRDDKKARIAEEEAAREAALRAKPVKKKVPDATASAAATPEQITLEEGYAADPAVQSSRRASFEADVPMPDGDVYEDIAPEPDPAIFGELTGSDEVADTVDDGRLSDKIDGFSEDEELPSPSEEASSETATPVGESIADDDMIDLRAIFAEASVGGAAATAASAADSAVPDEDDDIFERLRAAYLTDPADTEGETELPFTRATVSSPEEDEGLTEVLEAAPEYRFPPLDLLSPDTASGDTATSGELRENALKLVETLRSFNVKTRLVDVSRGPTVTRYELMPEAGTKVRTIANLTDDIALAFAAKGVRIEAPVPGKSAVGIEVPNKTAATVHLRSLLDDTRFTDAKSRLNAALGKDVAGGYVYLDIAKMPHLLIAGATGMGKSVCINCLIVSLLYKADPDEVKLILIDPKKVEFSLYSGLPHLLVPVVTDPKKAAGSLSWAVSEMERRFNLMECARVRDLAKYNELAKTDSSREPLPQIVIIIDELADLMMTASDDVETSICRLAQKARAAGMHLIIGTQRPSVDVITGLIKNNIPSRISCAVTSQVDSRTILDRIGAEKLIGRGDMLYKPVGLDPIRVQGAFVSESEVEAVVEFIKNQNTEKTETYSEEVIEQIEREAERCGVSGKKKTAVDGAEGAGDASDDDPMFRAALELAVDNRKISTSLIQRKLSLGYGRAAKLIDRMEELGYISAPDGQKPREVLLTKQEFMEMVLRDET